jgi:hypothetical protein
MRQAVGPSDLAGLDIMSATATAARHRIAIVGCGFGGLFAVKTLRRADVDLTVVDRTNHHLFPAAALAARNEDSLGG